MLVHKCKATKNLKKRQRKKGCTILEKNKNILERWRVYRELKYFLKSRDVIGLITI
jgi:hypothetical protein